MSDSINPPPESPSATQGAVLDELCAQLPALSRTLVGSAFEALTEAGAEDETVRVESGLGAARILCGLHLDAEVRCAALLYPLVRAGHASLDAVAADFGTAIAHLVSGVMRMDAIRASASGQKENIESLRKMLLAMVEDVRVVLIKLAARLQTMRELPQRPEADRRRLAQETRDIFAPLANRLGVWQLKWELEDLALRHLETETYQQIARGLAERRVDRDRYLTIVVAQLQTALDAHGVEAQVTSRSKHLYSIWRKMQRKGIGLDEVFDMRAVRILVPEVADCYVVLGIVHGLWQHIPREFDDYITNPKNNNYRSLHTAVIGPSGKVVEVQVRTFEMHEHSELGVAAHWRYKEGGSQDAGLERKIQWLRMLLEWKDELSSSEDLAEQFHVDDSEERIYVFTPQGKIIDLPGGSTPLDFAYHVHTDIGHRCRGGKVDGKLVQLTQPLQTGQQVEILTTKHPAPSRDWLNVHLGYLKTPRARSKVRHWFRAQDHDKNVTAGRAVLERELRRLGGGAIAYDRVAAQLGHAGTEPLFAAIGFGDVTTAQIAGAVGALLDQGRRDRPTAAPVRKRKAVTADDRIHVRGVGEVLTQLANCCAPTPGTPVIGFITLGRGITVHLSDCPNVLRLDGEQRTRLIEVDWGPEPEELLDVTLQVAAYDRANLLRDITAVLGKEQANVVGIHMETARRGHEVGISLHIEVEGIAQLEAVTTGIGALPNIIDVQRSG